MSSQSVSRSYCLCPCCPTHTRLRQMRVEPLPPPALALAPFPPRPQDVVLSFTEKGERTSNVPVFRRDWLRGSIDCWGYGGTGPFYLAMDILIWFGMDATEAWSWGSEFVLDYIEPVPQDRGAVISEATIRAFVDAAKSGKRIRVIRQGWDAISSRQAGRKREFAQKGGFSS